MTATHFASRVWNSGFAEEEHEAPHIPGYLPVGLLARGATSQVWRVVPAQDAQRDAAGAHVAIVREFTDVSAARARTLQNTRHPGLLPVTEVLHTHEGELAVIAPLLPMSLVAILEQQSAHGPLSAAEVAGLIEGLGNGLGRLHEAGLVHGDIREENVMVDARGRPVLIDLLEDPASLAQECSAGGDLEALAAMWQRIAPPGHPASGALGRMLAPMREAVGNAGELSARDLAAGAFMIAAGQPLLPARLGPVPELGSRRAARPALTPHVRRMPRAVVIAGFAGVGLLLGVLGGLGWYLLGAAGDARAEPGAQAESVAGSEEGAAQDVPAEPPHGPGEVGEEAPEANGTAAEPAPVSEEEVFVGVSAILAQRDDALQELDTHALSSLTVPGSPAAQQDFQILESLNSAGERPEGLRSSISDLTVVSEDPDHGEIVVSGQLSQAQSLRHTATGQRSVPAQQPRCVALTLHHQDAALRLRAVEPCA